MMWLKTISERYRPAAMPSSLGGSRKRRREEVVEDIEDDEMAFGYEGSQKRARSVCDGFSSSQAFAEDGTQEGWQDGCAGLSSSSQSQVQVCENDDEEEEDRRVVAPPSFSSQEEFVAESEAEEEVDTSKMATPLRSKERLDMQNDWDALALLMRLAKWYNPPDERNAPRQCNPQRQSQVANCTRIPGLPPRPVTPKGPYNALQQLPSPPPSTQQKSDMDTRRSKEAPPSNTLYIGNLPQNITKARLNDVFCKWGNIQRISLPLKGIRKPKVYGFVEHESIDEAKAALAILQGNEINGSPMRVAYATPDPKHPKNQDSHRRSDFTGHDQFSNSRAQSVGITPGLGVNPLPNIPPAHEAATNMESIVEPTLPPQKQSADPELCPEQKYLVNLILSGKNVFYTGSAGCGKSTVLKAFVKALRDNKRVVHIVAPTGRAALDVDGTTTWTYCGWTPDHRQKSIEEAMADSHKKQAWKRFTKTDVLVIDEISMVENWHLERINRVMKEARGNGKAFGGVQVVATGDFSQLPPVKPFEYCIECGKEMHPWNGNTKYRCANRKCPEFGFHYDKEKWAFCSKAWQECNFEYVNLTTIHRQNDIKFIDILNKFRLGKTVDEASIHLLLNHESETRNAVQLFATRNLADKVNKDKFDKIPFKPLCYKCLDHFEWHVGHADLKEKGQRITDGSEADGSLKSLKEHHYSPFVQLKKGMLVVLQSNLDISRGLVNGSQGTIQGFAPYNESNLPKAVRKGLPGTLGGDFAEYREQRILEFARRTNEQGWPIVQFQNGPLQTIYPDCTVTELGDYNPKCKLSRTQIPLTAGWAMTVHKAQGMTLNRVIVDLANTFEEGQVYVALSRARDLKGLKVLSLPKTTQTANREVKKFLKEKLGVE